jgi:hypothetical protein
MPASGHVSSSYLAHEHIAHEHIALTRRTGPCCRKPVSHDKLFPRALFEPTPADLIDEGFEDDVIDVDVAEDVQTALAEQHENARTARATRAERCRRRRIDSDDSDVEMDAAPAAAPPPAPPVEVLAIDSDDEPLPSAAKGKGRARPRVSRGAPRAADSGSEYEDQEDDEEEEEDEEDELDSECEDFIVGDDEDEAEADARIARRRAEKKAAKEAGKGKGKRSKGVRHAGGRFIGEDCIIGLPQTSIAARLARTLGSKFVPSTKMKACVATCSSRAMLTRSSHST